MSAALTSWKEIATYVGKSVRTVQRWEAELQLPIRRPDSRNRNIVVAVPAELDEWLKRKLQPRRIVGGGCSSNLKRMHSLVGQIIERTERNRQTTAELVKQFERRRRAPNQTQAAPSYEESDEEVPKAG